MACTSPRPSRRTSRTAFTAAPPEPDDPLLAFAPYAHKQPRKNAITPDRQRKFIATLAATGIVTQAARSIGVSLEALYKLRHKPGAEAFSAAWDAAIDRGITRLEDCALELAIQGEEMPVVSGGHWLGTYYKHNFGHIRFVLSQRRPERYRDTGPDFAVLRRGHPVYDQLRREFYAEMRANEPDIEEIRAEVLRRLAAMSRHSDQSGLAGVTYEGDADDRFGGPEPI